ncbi:MAG: tetrahydrofolate dehydrogenase/cyclohydrolase catalytic domain-containing protein [Clostridium sp.]|uniref:tetrahydrofolate dehydrogenase/cyclohydrolase catalytic domain-containing protein n=1 Tax=Clostridium sp. TaxID=1506 RepID=UPI003F2D9EAB
MKIDCRPIIEEWKKELKERVEHLNTLEIYPRLVIYQFGNEGPSNLYVGNKVKLGQELGIEVFVEKSEKHTTSITESLEELTVPVIIQKPTPGVDFEQLLNHLDPTLDVDGLTSQQQGWLQQGDIRAFTPATAKGVLRIIDECFCEETLEGYNVLIVNRSELIGMPLFHKLLKKNATVTIAHSKTNKNELKRLMKNADIIITGCGQRKIFNSDDLSMCQLIIDCSMHKVDGINGVGDFDLEDVVENCWSNEIVGGYGSTGPLTVLGLMESVLDYYELYEV